MNSLLLKCLLTVYILYSLLKFVEFFRRDDQTKSRGLRKIYVEGNGAVVRVFDNIILVVMIGFLWLLYNSGVEYISFTTGLLVGMTIIQVFFHRFSDPLPREQSPDPPVTALKLMSYSIQANPAKAWKEIALMTILLTWSLFMLVTHGWGLFNRR